MKKVSDRKTGKAGRCLGWMISVLLVFALAWGFVFMYPTMTREAQSVYQQYRTERMQEKLRNYLGEVYPLIDGMYVDAYFTSKILIGNFLGKSVVSGNGIVSFLCISLYLFANFTAK